jgi:hypothetical protein
MKRSSLTLPALGFLAALTAAADAQTKFTVGDFAVDADIMANGLNHPWGMDFLPGGDVPS